MSSDPARAAVAPATAELQAQLQRLLSDYFGHAVALTSLDRRPSDYRSSFLLEELEVRLGDGSRLPLIFKDLSYSSLTPAARAAKPDFLYEPRREIEVYRTILSTSGLGTAACYGAVIDATLDCYWLFIEDAPGVELYQVGDLDRWQSAARWLARFHACFADDLEALAARAHLLIYDRQLLALWMRRAVEFVGNRQPPPSNGAIEDLARLAKDYDRVVDQLLALPRTLLHGEFYASNVLVADSTGDDRVCPVDWEMSAIGPALIDLAALLTGLKPGEQASLAEAYHAALPSGSPLKSDYDSYAVALLHCRLHLAVQWLGWSPTWSPPANQAFDWLSEALRLASELGII